MVTKLHVTMISGETTAEELRKLIHSGEVKFAGNLRLKIYGKLSCTSGKRMKKSNRVFFLTEQEALDLGYRPCGNCLRHQYLTWKKLC